MSTKTPKNKPTPKSFDDGGSTPSKPSSKSTPKSPPKSKSKSKSTPRAASKANRKLPEDTIFCEFFDKFGYCTLGNKCKKTHERSRYTNPPPEYLNDDEKEEGHEALTEICFSFDVCNCI